MFDVTVVVEGEKGKPKGFEIEVVLDFGTDSTPEHRPKVIRLPRASVAGMTRLLSRVPEFSGLSQSTRRKLARASQVRVLTAGQTLWGQHDHASECCLVVEGRLMSMRFLSEPYGPRSLVGHLPLLAAEADTEPRRPAAMVATVRTVVMVIPYMALAEVLDQLSLPRLARRHARQLCLDAQPYS